MAANKNIKKKKIQNKLKTHKDNLFLLKEKDSNELNYIEFELILDSIESRLSKLDQIRWSVVCFDPSQTEYHESIYQNIDLLIENLKMSKSKLYKIYSNQYKGNKCNS